MKPTETPRTIREISIPDLIDRIGAFIRLCLSNKWTYVKFWVPTLLVTAIYVFGSTVEYTATTKILPYKSDRSMLGGLSGLAGLAGINLGGAGGSQVLSSDLYPDVVNSFSFRNELAQTPLKFEDGERSYQVHFETVQQTSLVDRISAYTIGLPRMALTKLRGKKPLPELVIDSTTVRYSELYMELIGAMDERLSVYYDRKTTVLTITAKMPDPVAAAELARATAAQLTRVIATYESRKASEQARFLKRQQQRVEERYRNARLALAEYQNKNRGTVFATDQIEGQVLQGEFTLAFDLYRSITQQLEASLVKEQEDTPVLTILEPAVIPVKPVEPKKSFSLIVAFLLSSIVATLVIGVKELGRPE
jgi:uncharacterized protein involved in exopolysaccharide biosynthesis